MGTEDQSSQLLGALGEIKGELKGINQAIERNHIATNQRLNDIQDSNNMRFDAIERRVEHVESEQKAQALKIAGWSSLSGAIISIGVAAIQHFK